MSINFSDYDNLLSNNYIYIPNIKTIERCNSVAINNNKTYFAITTDNILSNNRNNICMIGNTELPLKIKDDVFIDSNNNDIKRNKLYYVYKTPLSDKNRCIKKENVNTCLTEQQKEYFNTKIQRLDNKIIEINTQKALTETQNFTSSDYNDIKTLKEELYNTEKKNAIIWNDDLRNKETEINNKKEKIDKKDTYFLPADVKNTKCVNEVRSILREKKYTDRELVIQQQDEFNYKSALINKLNIVIIILIVLLFLTIIYYSDIITRVRKDMTANIKNFTNDMFA
jgi:hypothetical protein